jgi:translation initiation factor IF-1
MATRTQRLLRDDPFPVTEGTQQVGKVVHTPGSNIIVVRLAGATDGQPPMQARLPSKFKDTVWFRKDDFVIVDSESAPSADAAEAAREVLGWVVHKLGKPQIKHLRDCGLWPTEFEKSQEARQPIADGDDDDDFLTNHNHGHRGHDEEE